jgi:hypothetical protein
MASEPFNLTDRIVAFEEGELTDLEIYELFQQLIDSGAAWQLQGSYGRTAARLIMTGRILWTPEAQAAYEREFPLMFVHDLFHGPLHAVAAPR